MVGEQESVKTLVFNTSIKIGDCIRLLVAIEWGRLAGSFCDRLHTHAYLIELIHVVCDVILDFSISTLFQPTFNSTLQTQSNKTTNMC